ncbi:MAG: hypothetical protein QM765_29625 [Myxococcales bacterium]
MNCLVLRGERVDWAVPADSVVRLTTSDETVSVHALERLGFRPPRPAAGARTVVLRLESEELVLRVEAPLAFEEIDDASLCPLPELVQSGPALFSKVRLGEGRALLVVALEALGRRGLPR